ncbi:Z1 domain-containing protein [Providencia stuartii]
MSRSSKSSKMICIIKTYYFKERILNKNRDDSINVFINQINSRIQATDSIESAANAVKSELEILGVEFTDEKLEIFAIALDAVRAANEKKHITHDNSIIKQNEEWYEGPKADDIHWPALKSYLSNIKRWDRDTVTSIDDTSSEVVSLLANPKIKSFQKKGLVVGYVQSGKTANMTAVIAKAVDAGYNLIVILAGTTNKLRAQTQGRIDSDIVERNRHLWIRYTTSEDDGDFNIPPNRAFTVPTGENTQLVVMKKEKSRLEAFRQTIIGRLDDKLGTSPEALEKLKVLIIDDECDQASVNTSDDNSADMTSINSEIRKIIHALPSVSYVGYTATPFANVFIDPHIMNNDKDVDDLLDLYPEDFITALPRSRGYFGAREVFGFDPEDANKETDEEAGLNIIRNIPDEKIELLTPASRDDRESFHPELISELEHAILWFLISCSIRRYRKHVNHHMTMLIHTSQYTAQHANMSNVVRKWILDNKGDLIIPTSAIFLKMEKLFIEETKKRPLTFNDELKLTDLLVSLEEVLNNLEIAIENGESDSRLDYESGPKTYIVIGGTVLARGLTLEGLIVSFFLRTTKQYDTLLQMGRWFGYRNGYEDLPRLWTTTKLTSQFRALSYIEEEIRDDILKYKNENITPLEFAVRVRSIPGMAITAISKMGSASRSYISFEGRHVQTIRYEHKNKEIVNGNWGAASTLINELIDKNEKHSKVKNNQLFSGISIEIIKNFLEQYSICNNHMNLNNKMILDYIERNKSTLDFWNVGVISPESGELSKKELGKLGIINTNNRSQLDPTDKEIADIKALMSKRDILIDYSGEVSIKVNDKWSELKKLRPNLPLLLIYPIDANSKPNTATRTSLDAVDDLIGIGIVFPGDSKLSGSYYSVELDIPEPDEDDVTQ